MFIDFLHKDDMSRADSDKVPFERKGNIGYPSEALASVAPFNVGECSRSFYYKLKKEPYSDLRTIKSLSTCDIGNIIEKDFITRFKNSGTLLADNVKTSYIVPNNENNLIITGKIDVIIEEDNIKKGIEIKTVKGYGADLIFGEFPLPASSNLMQALIYKFVSREQTFNNHMIESIYLMYVRKEDYSRMYFEIDIDADGYPIITPIRENGQFSDKIHLASCLSYDDLLARTQPATTHESKLAELRINIHNIMQKYNSVFTFSKSNIVPQKDYNIMYTDTEAEKQYHCGRISKLKLSKHKKGETTGDFRCGFCRYKTKCLSTLGIRLR